MNTFLLLLAVAALSQTSNERYLDCIALLEADVDTGRLAAQQWADEGGGPDAQHCLALADIAAGYVKLGALRLEDIAERKDAGNVDTRARLLDQAAQAWLQADRLDEAQRALDKAFSLTPDSGDLHLTAAKIYAAQKQWTKVQAAAAAAEEAGVKTAEVYVLSGKAHYALGDYETAANDVVSALTIDPTNIDALTLRGDIQQTGIAIEVFYGDEDNAGKDDAH